MHCWVIWLNTIFSRLLSLDEFWINGFSLTTRKVTTLSSLFLIICFSKDGIIKMMNYCIIICKTLWWILILFQLWLKKTLFTFSAVCYKDRIRMNLIIFGNTKILWTYPHLVFCAWKYYKSLKLISVIKI